MSTPYDSQQVKTILAERGAQVEAYLQHCLDAIPMQGRLKEAMYYSLLAGGKRLRPVLCLSTAALFGLSAEAVMPFAASLEMIHTYSLIHDDLPVMDNDDLRRGKPSNHKVFGECTATLAGDALQALAFETILKADLPALRALKCAQILANAAGHEGICGGQQLDLEWEGKILSAPELEEIYLRKTSALIRAACLMGVAAAGGTQAQKDAAARYADHFGYAFQIRDDMLDVIGDEKTFGKPIGSDKAEGKVTLVDVKGLEQCQRDVEQYTARAKAAIAAWPDNSFLLELADHMVNRVK